jgi:DUF971 family protein
MPHKPVSIDLDRARHLVITWDDERVSTYPIAHLRRMSPSADAKELRRELAANPLAVLPPGGGGGSGGPITAESAELVGNYALRITFSDGHATGIYSWDYLREIDPASPPSPASPASPGGPAS